MEKMLTKVELVFHEKICEDFFNCGVNVITTGNHVWDQKDIMNFIDEENRLLRPKNLFEPFLEKVLKFMKLQIISKLEFLI